MNTTMQSLSVGSDDCLYCSLAQAMSNMHPQCSADWGGAEVYAICGG